VRFAGAGYPNQKFGMTSGWFREDTGVQSGTGCPRGAADWSTLRTRRRLASRKMKEA
jgi:hypothetical protein